MDMNMFIARLNWLWKFWRENGPSGEIMSWFTDLKQGYLEVSFIHGGYPKGKHTVCELENGPIEIVDLPS